MDLFSFIKQNVDILSVIGEYTSLKKTGSLYWKARCPFHYENTPSFTVSPHKNIYYCFGCHASGDVVGFIEKIENLSALEAAQHLAARYNLEIPQEVSKSLAPVLNKSYYQLCYIVAHWCSTMLSKNLGALEYIKKRNLTAVTCTQFMLGYFPSGSKAIQQLLAHVTPLGFSSQDLVDANIIFPGKQGLYSPYEDRIIFPIKDHLGQVCGFGGRIFLPHDTRPKYYNSKESDYFKKGKILFGFDVAKSEIQKQQSAILVEGYMDCIALSQYGCKNVVATLGTAGSLEHLQQLAKHAQKIFLLYDADNAGKQAIIRLTTSCWQLDLDLKVVVLPVGQDPASMLEQHQDILPYIAQAQEIFTFFVDIKGDNFAQESMKHKMAVVHEMFELIAQVKDSLKQNILLMKISQNLQIPLEIIKNEYTYRYGKNIQTAVPSSWQHDMQYQPIEQMQAVQQEKLEEQILAILLYDPSLLTVEYETLLLAALTSNHLNIIQKMVQCKQQDKVLSSEFVASNLNVADAQLLQRVMFSVDSSNLKQTLQALMLKFKKKYWKTLASHIRMKILQAQKMNDIPEVQRLIDVFEELKNELCKNGRL